MLVFQTIGKAAFACACDWCRERLRVGDRVVYGPEASFAACSAECAANLMDDARDREAARKLRRLPAIGSAVLEVAA